MKKIFAILLITIMTLSIVACGNEPSTSGNDAQQGTESELKVEEDAPESADIIMSEEFLGYWLVSDDTRLKIEEFTTYIQEVDDTGNWKDVTMLHIGKPSVEGNTLYLMDVIGGILFEYNIEKNGEDILLSYIGYEDPSDTFSQEYFAPIMVDMKKMMEE